MVAVSKLLDLLFPPKCAFCHKLLSDNDTGGICKKCKKNLPYVSGSDIKQKFTFISACVAPLYYEGDVRESLLRYKFSQCTGYAKMYSKMLAECIEENIDSEFDFITWVPLSKKRLRKRGYDQARLIAETTAKNLQKQAVPLLKKVRNVKPQSGTGSADKRRANISSAYEVISPELVSGKNILIIDDIVTTGSTLSECARMLGMSGVQSVMAAAIARRRD